MEVRSVLLPLTTPRHQVFTLALMLDMTLLFSGTTHWPTSHGMLFEVGQCIITFRPSG